jgi:hypothetical protein
MGVSRRTFTREFKLAAVRRLEARGFGRGSSEAEVYGFQRGTMSNVDSTVDP